MVVAGPKVQQARHARQSHLAEDVELTPRAAAGTTIRRERSENLERDRLV
jgi:hypothetical protein